MEPRIAEGEFLPPQEQSNSVDDLIGDQDRLRRPLDKSLLNALSSLDPATARSTAPGHR